MTGFPWLKLYNEAPTDPKWLAVADIAGSSPAIAWHTFSAQLAYANEQPNRGSVAGFNPQIVASFCRVAVDEVKRVIQAFRELGLLLGERIAKWTKRQTEKLAKPQTPNAIRQERHKRKVAAAKAQGKLDLPGMADTAPVTAVTAEPEALLSTVSSGADREIERESPPVGPPRGAPPDVGRSRGQRAQRTSIGEVHHGPPRQHEILMSIPGGRSDGRRRETAAERRMREYLEMARAIMAGEVDCGRIAACSAG